MTAGYYVDPPEHCSWDLVGDEDGKSWDTACGRCYFHDTGGVDELIFDYCPFCRRPIQKKDRRIKHG